MTTLKTDQVKSFFHRYSGGFNAIYRRNKRPGIFGCMIDHWFRKSMFYRFNKTLDELRSDNIKSILDIGCGPGRYCVEYLKMGKKVLGIDLAEGMLKLASQICKQESHNTNYQFLLGNYMDIQLSEKFDAAVLMGLFDYVSDPVHMLKKLKIDIKNLILASFPKSGGLLAMQRKLRYRLRNCPLFLYSRNMLEEVFKSAGVTQYEMLETDREFFVKIFLA